MIRQPEYLQSGSVRDAIQVQSVIAIAAPPKYVAAIYRDVETWTETFSVTVEQARITGIGDNWKQVEVIHRMEGPVPNTFIFLSETKIALEESKRQFDAVFLNQFFPLDQRGAHYMITAYIMLKGVYRLLKPVLQGYVRRRASEQMSHYVLEPLSSLTRIKTLRLEYINEIIPVGHRHAHLRFAKTRHHSHLD